ncbi:phosphatase PAP2 family protein [Pseudoxanthomonas wuyuanensis]|nr:phosphatase PAP2 family protein [Pseudoxanthomonas wuyuanensis]
MVSRPAHGSLRLLLLPMLGFALAWVVLVPMRGDQWWADRLLAWEGGQWKLGHSLLLETVIHRGGKRLSVLTWLAAVGITVWMWQRPDLRHWRRPAVALLLSVLLSTLTVSMLKSITHMDCPWDLLGYGGQRPFIDLFAARPAELPAAACFPAGHASAGYAWVALYFFAGAVRPQWRGAGLWTGLAAGLVFGLAQQLRGAHFLSHDLASLMVCWLVALAVYRLVAADGRSVAQGAAA